MIATLRNRLHYPSQTSTAAMSLDARYVWVRQRTEALVAHLSDEDIAVRASLDAKTVKWRLAHTTWFFETFVLSHYLHGYQRYDPDFSELFGFVTDTYDHLGGPNHREVLSRPSAADVRAYREYVDLHMAALISDDLNGACSEVVQTGLALEERHQELIVVDVQSLFASSVGASTPAPLWSAPIADAPARFRLIKGGLVQTGADNSTFALFNEKPRHTAWLDCFELSDRLVTNREWLAFIEDGGYQTSHLWLADGWERVIRECWFAPLYWQNDGVRWQHMTPRGREIVQPDAAVMHISYYEADAYARWARARLPTEAEWEHAASSHVYLKEIADVAWQWTSSAYAPYPRQRTVRDVRSDGPSPFVSGHMVLRGGSSVTAPGPTRITYRNFHRPDERRAFSGLRLARDVPGLRETNNSDSGAVTSAE